MIEDNEAYYGYDDLNVIGVSKKGVFVKPEDQMVYLLFTRKMWNKTQKEWLDRKMDYCERYGHFCGWGSIISKVEYAGDGTYNIHKEDFTTEVVDIPIYKVLDVMVDMEHG